MISFFPFIHHSLHLQVNGYKAEISEVTAFLHLYATTIKCPSTSFPSLLSPGLELKEVRAGVSLAGSTRVCLLAHLHGKGFCLSSYDLISPILSCRKVYVHVRTLAPVFACNFPDDVYMQERVPWTNLPCSCAQLAAHSPCLSLVFLTRTLLLYSPPTLWESSLPASQHVLPVERTGMRAVSLQFLYLGSLTPLPHCLLSTDSHPSTKQGAVRKTASLCLRV